MWLGESIVPRCANHPCWPGQLHDVPGMACRNYRRKPKLPSGDAVRMIPLGDGFYAYVDAADYEWLSQYHWHLQNGYAARREKTRVILMHREIMQPPTGMVVDHIDGNKANNCRFNLRTCTPAENRRNNRKRNDARSKFKGVSYHERMRKWRARCWCKGRDPFLDYFDTDVEAARAYDRVAVEYFGEFARLNFPEEWPPERRAQVYAQRDAMKRRTEDRRRRTDKAKKGKRDKTKGKRSARRRRDAGFTREGQHPPESRVAGHEPRPRSGDSGRVGSAHRFCDCHNHEVREEHEGNGTADARR